MLLLIAAPDALVAQTVEPEATAGIFGYVKDSLDVPVADVVVTLEESGLSRLTNARGFFVFDSLAPGIEIIRFEHLVYDDREVSLALRPGRATRLDVQLQTMVLGLEPLLVSVRGTMRLRQMRGFEHRREMRSGLFYDVEDLRRMVAPRLGTLLREVPGLAIDYRALHPPYSGSFAARMRHRPCRIDVWINGRLKRRGGQIWLRELGLSQLEAVEIYKKGQIPVEFAGWGGGPDCIAIVAWTR